MPLTTRFTAFSFPKQLLFSSDVLLAPTTIIIDRHYSHNKMSCFRVISFRVRNRQTNHLSKQTHSPFIATRQRIGRKEEKGYHSLASQTTSTKEEKLKIHCTSFHHQTLIQTMKRYASTTSGNKMVVVDDDGVVLQQANSDDTANNTDNSLVNDSLNSFAACFCCNPFETVLPDFVSLQGQAFDGILVTSTRTGRVAASDVLINFDHPTSPFPPNAPNVYTATNTNTLSTTSSSSSKSLNRSTSELAEGDCQALLEIDDPTLGKVYFPIVHDAIRKKNRLGGRPSPKCDCMDDRRNSNSSTENNSSSSRPQQEQHKRTCSSGSNSNNSSNPAAAEKKNDDEQEALTELASLLKPGKNPVRYLFRNHQRVLGAVQASIFLWSDRDRIVVCDVDGTITKTNVRGIYDTIVTEKYGYCHDRVCQFMSSLKGHSQQSQTQSTNEQKGEETGAVNVLYLTSRPLFIAQTTRRFLSNLTQGKGINNNSPPSKMKQQQQQHNTDQEETHRLPEGPLMGFAGRFLEVMKMELMTKTVHLFKASLLMDQVVTPFCDVSENPHEKHQSLFVAGFGNTLMDVQAYHMAGMNLSQIYFIDKKSKIACFDGETQEGSPSKRPSFRRASSSSRTTSSSSLSSGSSPTASGSFKVPKDILDPDATNTFLLVDAAQPTAVTNNRPCLKTPLPQKSYKLQMGTSFAGYHDERLTSHVLDTNASV